KFALEFIHTHHPSASGRGGGALESAGANRPTSQGWAGSVRSDGPVFLRRRTAQSAATSWSFRCDGQLSPLRRGRSVCFAGAEVDEVHEDVDDERRIDVDGLIHRLAG